MRMKTSFPPPHPFQSIFSTKKCLMSTTPCTFSSLEVFLMFAKHVCWGCFCSLSYSRDSIAYRRYWRVINYFEHFLLVRRVFVRINYILCVLSWRLANCGVPFPYSFFSSLIIYTSYFFYSSTLFSFFLILIYSFCSFIFPPSPNSLFLLLLNPFFLLLFNLLSSFSGSEFSLSAKFSLFLFLSSLIISHHSPSVSFSSFSSSYVPLFPI